MLQKIMFWILGIYTTIEFVLMYYVVKTNNKSFPIENIIIVGMLIYLATFVIVRLNQIRESK